MKRKSTKRILALILTAVMLVSAVPLGAMTAFAAEEEPITSGDFEYVVQDDGTAKITGYTGNSAELTIPSELDGKRVTAISSEAFLNNCDIETVTIPAGVSNIRDNIFKYCYGLKNIYVDPVNSDYCSVDGVLLNKAKTEIISYPIGNERVIYYIPAGVETVCSESFRDSLYLKALVIPNSLKSVESTAFTQCTGLDHVFYQGTEEQWNAINFADIEWGAQEEILSANIHYNWNGEEITELDYKYDILDDGTAKITEYVGQEDIISVPEKINGYTVTVVDFSSWTVEPWQSFSTIVIPSAVKDIPLSDSFGGSNPFVKFDFLSAIEVAEGNANYSSIDGVLYNKDKTELLAYPCKKWDSYMIPDGVTRIIPEAFRYGELRELCIPGSLEYIGKYAFGGCEYLQDVNYTGTEAEWNAITIENETGGNEPLLNAAIHYNYAPVVEIIDSGLCGATTQWQLDSSGTLTISGTGIVKNYNRASLVPWNKYASQINGVVVEEGVTRIGEFAFYGCANLTSVKLADSVKEINGYVFKNCSSLTEITLPASLEKIGDSAFYGTALDEITIPATVKSIGYYAFSRCYSLKNVEFAGNAPVFYSNAFNKVAATVRYPANNKTWTASKKQPYGGTLKWVQTGLIDEGYCGSTTAWKLSEDGVLIISGTGIVKNYNSASIVPWLKYASQIKSVVVEEGVTRIGEFAFYGCANLTSVKLADSVKEINGYVFKNCSNLENITLPANLEKIGDSAFYGTDITYLSVPSTVKYIGWYAFSRCYSLDMIEFAGSAPEFPGKVFNMVTATVYHPAGDSSWDSVLWDKLGGNIDHIAIYRLGNAIIPVA